MESWNQETNRQEKHWKQNLIKHSVQFISSLNNTVSVIAVHHKDETLSVLEVVPPQWTNLTTSAAGYIPCAVQKDPEVAMQNQKLVNTLSWPPTSQTVKLMFLYSTVSTLKPVCTNVKFNHQGRCQHVHIAHWWLRNVPMVGMVVTISPSLSLYKMVVLPAASRPTMRILISFLAKSLLKSFANDNPILLH